MFYEVQNSRYMRMYLYIFIHIYSDKTDIEYSVAYISITVTK